MFEYELVIPIVLLDLKLLSNSKAPCHTPGVAFPLTKFEKKNYWALVIVLTSLWIPAWIPKLAEKLCFP